MVKIYINAFVLASTKLFWAALGAVFGLGPWCECCVLSNTKQSPGRSKEEEVKIYFHFFVQRLDLESEWTHQSCQTLQRTKRDRKQGHKLWAKFFNLHKFCLILTRMHWDVGRCFREKEKKTGTCRSTVFHAPFVLRGWPMSCTCLDKSNLRAHASHLIIIRWLCDNKLCCR